MDIVARQLRQQHGLLVVHCSWFNLPLPQEVHAAFSAHEHRFGVHAGEVETSMLLHLAPEQVQMARAQNFASTSATRAQRFAILGNGKSAKLGWAMQDYNPAGAAGNAAQADAQRGQALVEAAAQGLAQLLQKCTNCRWIPWAQRIKGAMPPPAPAAPSGRGWRHPRHASRPAPRVGAVAGPVACPAPRPIGQSC